MQSLKLSYSRKSLKTSRLKYPFKNAPGNFKSITQIKPLEFQFKAAFSGYFSYN